MMSLLTGCRMPRTRIGWSPAHWRHLCMATLVLLSLPLWAAPTDIIVLLDNSGSMRQNDPSFALKGSINKFFTNLPADTRAGVLIFDQKVTYPVPMAAVDDAVRAAVTASLTKIDYRGQYTNIPAAMERAIYELKTTGRKDAAKIVVFMTDGIVDTGNPAFDAEKAKWLRDDLAVDAADNGIRIFGIAFTENADFFLIQSLAKKTSGEYFRALKPDDLDAVFANVEERLGAGPVVSAPAAAPSAAPEPAAAGVAAPAGAATTDACLAALPADDRDAIEQMASAAGTTAAALCAEMANTPAGQPVVTPAPAPASATDTDTATNSDSTMGVALVAGSALVLLLAAGVLIFIFLKRRNIATPAAEPARGQAAATFAAPARVPEAFVKDINGITKEPAVQLTVKPLMIGRIPGTDPDHADYFVVEMATIGRRHAVIRYRDFCFWLADQGSVNGTYLNGERIEGERQLKHGDRVRFHKYEFEFSMPEMANADHTVFADPLNRTMVGDVDTMVGTAAAMAGGVVAADVIARAGAHDDDDDDVFDLTGGAPAPRAGDAGRSADDDSEFVSLDGDFADDDEADEATALPINLRSGILSGTVARAEAEFDAEASAFFDEDDLAVTASPHSGTVIERGPMLRLDDEADDALSEDTMQMPAVEFTPRAPAPEDDFSESETLLPVSPEVAARSGGVDISLDAFMDTDSFDQPGPDSADADQDATLMPEQVADRTLAIDDIFDVTAEGTIAPVRPGDDDDEDHDRTTLLR